MIMVVGPRRHGKLLIAAAIFMAVAIALVIPEPSPDVGREPGGAPFVWDADATWDALEAHFVAAMSRGCADVADDVDAGLGAIDAELAALAAGGVSHDDPALARLEGAVFDVAPLVAACPERAPDLIARVTALRARVKELSRGFRLADRAVRTRLYRLLYGSRTALEEVLLQGDPAAIPVLIPGTDEPSSTPATNFLGAEVRSGDMLVSRGGAPTSALIARGNDFPGNFSHVALVHVGDDGSASVIEAHIESGVVVSTLDEYLRDTKLRVMALRLSSSLPAVRADPLLPHRAAAVALAEATSGHVPYDFAMDIEDHGEKFCSEVASAPYEELGVPLWEGLTSMSTSGVRRWLSRFGVTHFSTHGPSDLEYDPKVVVVFEWRDPETLFLDHVDNAVIDVLLEGAEAGDALGYDLRRLPLARLAKAYSAAKNLFGGVGPVPEGMSATTALRAEWLKERHGEIRRRVLARVERFRREEGYTPPYWELVKMARASRR